MSTNDAPKKLLWMDLEMTGLEPEEHHILEVAALVTDFECNELGSYAAVVHQPERVLDEAHEWVRDMFGGPGGLFDDVRASKTNLTYAELSVSALVSEHWGKDEKPILAGNSIHQDRRFIAAHWPRLNERLHYRMLDVSSFKVWLQGTTGERFEKKESHRALDDIRESIAELQWILSKLRG